jgi:two-component system KDP operon response regulator KdpE
MSAQAQAQVQGNGPRILIVDDEKAIRRFLKTTLAAEGMTLSEAASGREALDGVTAFHPDVIVLDLGLPDMDGIEVTRTIRKKSQVPIIILSVREQESDKIAALDAGADDYLTKPFSAGELLARLRAIMRRLARKEGDPVFKSGKLLVDLSKRLIQMGDKEVHLSPTEYDVLKMLVLSAGKVLTHSQILEGVWGKNPDDFEGVNHLLRVTISNLRSKLEPNPTRPTHILTEPGVGYRLKYDA